MTMLEQEKFEDYQFQCIRVAGVFTFGGLVASLMISGIMQGLNNNLAMNILFYVNLVCAVCAVCGVISLLIVGLSGLVKVSVKRKVIGKKLVGVVEDVDEEREYNVWYVHLFFKKFVASVEVC